MALLRHMIKLGMLVVLCLHAFGCSSRKVYQSSVVPSSTLPGAININTASIDDIEKLPRIGRKTAEAIVEFREMNGPYRRTEHLMQVRGISERRFLEIRGYLRTD